MVKTRPRYCLERLFFFIVVTLIFSVANGQCPTIEAALINSCASGPGEGINEFVVFNTTASAPVSDYVLDYGSNNPPAPTASAILDGSTTTTPSGGGVITATSCTIINVTSPATIIPAGSRVIFIPADFAQTYEVSALCNGNPIYVAYIDRVLPTLWNAGGTFANNPTGPRYLQIANASNSCTSNVVIYNNNWASNTDGNFVSWSASGVANYNNTGCTVIPPLSPVGINITSIGPYCKGTSFAPVTFTTYGSPNRFTIVWSAAALAVGFFNLANVTLPGSPLLFPIPGSVPPGTYTGVLTVKNTTTGLSSTPQTITIIIKPTSTSTSNIAICPSALPYTWNGTAYPSAGTFTKTLINSVGCDSIATLVLSIKPTSISTTNIAVCPSVLPYTWNGTAYPNAGTFTTTLINSLGCDSIATLNLSIKSISASTTNIAVCPSALPYTWNGTAYPSAGTFTKTLINSVGCDSVATLNLSVKATSASTTNIAVCPSALPYIWNGTAYPTPGTFTKTLINSVGCDSIATLALSIKPTSASTTNIAVCPSALPYIWNGTAYPTPGTFTKTLINSVGCDSIATLALSIKPTSTSTTNIAVCPSVLPYTWNGTAYPSAGTFTKTLINSVGCDSIATLVLSIKPTSTSITNIAICPSALPYTWNGTVYPSTGTFTKTLVNSLGCDSVATLVLSVKTTSTSTTNIAVCPSALPYTWKGTAYPSAGTFTKTLINSAGCDSIATLNLSIKSTSTSTTNIAICPSALPYTWNGIAYPSAGTFTKTLVNAAGCDSIATLVLSIKPTSTSTTNIAICPSALPYTWNGTAYPSAGTFTKTLVNSVGCDSVATLNLSVKATSTSITNITICPSAMPYIWNGTAYSSSGTYTRNLINSAGCDSVATLVLSVNSVLTSTTNVTICPNSLPYLWNGTLYPSAGTFTRTLVNSAGCDSIATLLLSIKPASATTINIAICPSALPYTWNGTPYPSAGTFTKTLINSVGCDSVATLVLTAKPTSTSTTNIAVCPSALPYTWNGTAYPSAGTFTKTLINSVGCDSVATLVLTAKPTSTSTTNIAVCPSALPYTWNGTAYPSAGTFTKTLINSVGCDSVATLNLSVKATSASTTNIAVCPSALPYIWNGTAYPTPGTFTKTLINSVGCDSIATLALSIKPTSTSTTNIAFCPSVLPYTWNGTAYPSAGTFTKTLINSVGCDSIATLVLSIKPTSTSITNIAICPSALPYTWNGTAYPSAGTFTKTLVNSVGCDSVATLNLSVKATSTSITNITICPSAMPYIWNGTAYSSSGTYTRNLINSAGCDSVATLVLSVNSVLTSTTNVTICPNSLPYLWNGTLYPSAGTFTRTLVNSAGCDSIATLLLSIKPASATTINIAICPSALPYTWNGTPYPSAGTFTKTLINSVGCDSVATLVLTAKPTSTSTTNIAVCPSALPYTWNGTAYPSAGTFTKTLVNSIDCDSVATLVLSINPTSTSTTNIALCPSALPYTWNGTAYTSAGTFAKTLINSAGCDSIVTLNLSVNAATTSTTIIAVCPSSLPYTWNGTAYPSAGIFTKILINSVGCDSAATLVLSVKPTSTSITNIAVCPSALPYTWNGTAYTSAGTFTKTLINSVGCDSVATLVLSIKPTSTSITNIAICPSALPYTWNGTAYPSAGTFTKSLVNSTGCDSIATLVLSIKPTSTSTTDIAVCPSALPFTWNGTAYPSAGTFTKTFINSVGCDSIATLVLSIKPTSISTTNIAVCPSVLPYTWNGTAYPNAGTFTKTLINSVGCDSVATLVLSIKPTSTSITNIAICPSALPYTWNGTAYPSAGTFTKSLVNSTGCDSIATLVLSIKPTSTSTTDIAVCPSALPFTWNGTAYPSAGTFTKTFINSVGCDSIATLVLSIKPTSISTTNIAVCPSVLPYTWNGTAYPNAGTFTKTLINSVGCDSVATLVLSVKTTSTSTTNIAVCPSALPYTWNGTAYPSAGTFTKTLINSVGCDSVATLTLSVRANSTSTTRIVVCPSALPYVWNGTSYASSGAYTKILVNSVGCDSIAVLILSIKPTSTSTTSVAVCPSQLPYSWNGTTYPSAGTFIKSLVNSIGCDSIATLVLTIKAISTSATNIAVCPSALPYFWNGTAYPSAGIFTKTFINAVGCDSVATLNLLVKATSTSTTNIAVCPSGLPYNWNGTAYTSAGTFTKILVNTAGCDSVATLIVSVKLTLASTTNIVVCSAALPYNWNGNSYSTAGTYTKNLLSSAGCDSIATLILTVNNTPATPVLTSNSPVCLGQQLLLTADAPNAVSYQWITPTGQGINAQNPVLNNVSIAQSGAYKVTASANGCNSTPATITVSVVQTPIVNAGIDIPLYEGDTAILSPSVTGTNLSYQWSPNLYFISADSIKNPTVYAVQNITYTITVSQNNLCTVSDKLTVKVLPRLKPIYIPNVFSPNNDGVNDVWIIRQLAPYPEATVDVYTRYGRNVFTSAGGYRKPWDGTANSKLLPAGTYYYIITLNKKSKPYSGWVEIVR